MRSVALGLPSPLNRAKISNRRLWASLCVSAVMLAALSTGIYSTMVEPTQTNIVTATRTTESSTYSEKTRFYTGTSIEVTTVRTVTSSFTSCSYKECHSRWVFYPSIELVGIGLENFGLIVTWHNVCILWEGDEVKDYRYPMSICRRVSTSIFSVSKRTLTHTSMSLTRSLVQFPVTVTESLYEIVPNPEKFNLQRLTVVLFIIGVAGIALAMLLGPSVSGRVAEDHRVMTKSTKFCRNCGAKIPRDSNFCEECGTKLAC